MREKTTYLELQHISKSYGKVQALEDLNLTLYNGITGLLGPNGAGKSTMIQLIGQMIFPDRGCIRLNGKNIDASTKQLIGIMPQQQEMYPSFTVWEFMTYIGALKELKRDQFDEEINLRLAQVGLQEKVHEQIRQLSGGMKQRLLIAQALLGNPPVLIFDEPTAGLDPSQRIEIRNLFSSLGKDHLVLIATHVVQDIESIADRVVLIFDGHVLMNASPLQIVSSVEGKVKEVLVDEEELARMKGNMPIANCSLKKSTYWVDEEANDEKPLYLVRIITDYPISGAQLVYPTLEDAYLWYTGK